jgi:hypothetical protein
MLVVIHPPPLHTNSVVYDKRFSPLMMLPPDFPRTLPVALMPSPSLLTLVAREITSAEVRSLAIGVPLRSLNCLPQLLQRYL